MMIVDLRYTIDSAVSHRRESVYDVQSVAIERADILRQGAPRQSSVDYRRIRPTSPHRFVLKI